MVPQFWQCEWEPEEDTDYSYLHKVPNWWLNLLQKYLLCEIPQEIIYTMLK
jgi:hypothetical protein